MKFSLIAVALVIATLNPVFADDTSDSNRPKFNPPVDNSLGCALKKLNEMRGQSVEQQEPYKDLNCSRHEISFHDFMEVHDLDISLVRSGMAAGIDRYLEHLDEGCSLDTTDLRRRIEQAVSKRHSYADLISKDTWGSAWNKYAEALFDLIVCE